MEHKDLNANRRIKSNFVDGKLPDIDYTLMKMKNLDDLNGETNPLGGRHVLQCSANSTGALDTVSPLSNEQLLGLARNSCSSVYSHRCTTGSRRLVSPTQVVHTTPDRLAQTMHMQQRLYQMRLDIISRPVQSNDAQQKQIQPREIKNWPNSCTPSDKDHLTWDDNDTKPEGRLSGRWIVRRRTDGTRYITRRCSNKESTFKSPKHRPHSAICIHSNPSSRICSSDQNCAPSPIRSRFPSAPTGGLLGATVWTETVRTRSSSTSKSSSFRSRKVLVPQLILDDTSDTLLSVTTL